mgnify:CR=1 FL=1
MDLKTDTTAVGGVTFVSVVVANPYDEPARFRIQNALDGPVWPPRTRGYPEAGWDEDGYEGVLDAGEQRALGYAAPSSPSNPPVAIAWTEPAADSGSEAEEGESLPALRSFGDPRPPRSVLSPITRTEDAAGQEVPIDDPGAGEGA